MGHVESYDEGPVFIIGTLIASDVAILRFSATVLSAAAYQRCAYPLITRSGLRQRVLLHGQPLGTDCQGDGCCEISYHSSLSPRTSTSQLVRQTFHLWYSDAILPPLLLEGY